MKASMFYRIAAVLPLLFAIGQTLGFRQADPESRVDALIGSMRLVHFDIQGLTARIGNSLWKPDSRSVCSINLQRFWPGS